MSERAIGMRARRWLAILGSFGVPVAAQESRASESRPPESRVAESRPAESRVGSRPASRPAPLEVQTRIVLPVRNQPLKVAGIEVSMSVTKERPEYVKKLPDGLADPSFLSAAVLGHRLLVAVADNADGNTGTVLADRNEDGDLTQEGERLTATIVRRMPFLRYMSGLVFEFGDFEASPLIQRTRLGPFTGVLTVARHREGTAVIAGAERVLVLVDADLDGDFAGPGDYWLLTTAERMWRPRVRLLGPSSMIEAAEPVFLGDQTVRLEKVDDDGKAQLRIERATEDRSESLRRRAERVRARSEELTSTDARGLLKECGIDPARAKAKEPLPWLHTLDLEAAKAAAARAKKPLLVCFDAESVASCRFLERYVLEDRAVAEKLSSFVLVRWNVELDESDLSASYGIHQHPKVAVLDSHGKLLHSIVGFTHPERFLAELEKALSAAK